METDLASEDGKFFLKTESPTVQFTITTSPRLSLNNLLLLLLSRL